MKYYHVRFDIENESRVFIPQVPGTAMDYEDTQIPRICVSTSLEGAISGCPSGQARLVKAAESQMGLIRVFCFDTDKIPDLEVWGTDKLMEDGLVPDANLSNECWILNTVELEESDVKLELIMHWMFSPKAMDSGSYMHTVDSLIKLPDTLGKGERFILPFETKQISMHTDSWILSTTESGFELVSLMDQSNRMVLNPLAKTLIDSETFKSDSSRLMFTYNNPMVVREIEKGLHLGEKFTSLITPQFAQMEIMEIRLALEQGLDPTIYAIPTIHWQAMKSLRKALELGLDVSGLVHPEISYGEVWEFVKSKTEPNMKKLSIF